MMTLLLVGISARAAAESAISSGYNVQALDCFGDTDLSAICPSFSLLHDFPDMDRETDPATVRLFLCSRELDFEEVAYGSGFENHPECVEEWERMGKTILGNDSETLRAVRDWEGLFDFLDRRGTLHPETYLTTDLTKFDLNSINPEKFIVKPALSGGGHGIRLLGDLLRSQIFPQDRDEKPILVQKLLHGTLASASFVSGDERFHMLSTTLQLVGNAFSKYRYAGNIAPLDAPAGIRRKMEDISRSIATEYKLRGSNGVDFILVGGDVYVLEVNPRLQGSLDVVEKASGKPIFDAHIKACRGGHIPSGKRRVRGFSGRRVVFAPLDLNTQPLGGLGFVKDLPEPGTPIREGAPICTVHARSSSISACKHLLRRKEKIVISILT